MGVSVGTGVGDCVAGNSPWPGLSHPLMATATRVKTPAHRPAKPIFQAGVLCITLPWFNGPHSCLELACQQRGL